MWILDIVRFDNRAIFLFSTQQRAEEEVRSLYAEEVKHDPNVPPFKWSTAPDDVLLTDIGDLEIALYQKEVDATLPVDLF